MNGRARLLVVEDDPDLRQFLEEELAEAGYDVLTAAGGAEALALLEGVDVIVTDQMMPGMKGSELLAEVRARAPEIPVVIITAFGSIESAVQAMRAGAHHYVAKPFRMEQLLATLVDALREQRLRRQIAKLRQEIGVGTTRIVAESRAMRSVIDVIHRAAGADTPVLLLGESGTGKELLARALHEESPRHDGAFIPVNCSAIPETLLESQLFGHRRGSFTDAREDHRGLFQEAEGGTVFLDEIGDMPPALQGKLLRVLQEKEVHPLGAPMPVRVDVRVVAATHRDLDHFVEQGRFRQDLLYRLNVISVRIPPLRERRDDLLPLVAHFLEKHGKRLGRDSSSLSEDAILVLQRHGWPGNVRELENAIERALVLGQGGRIRPEDLPDAVRARPVAGAPSGSSRPLADVERDHILTTLKSVRSNKAAAARILGLDRKTLYRKLRSYQIQES